MIRLLWIAWGLGRVVFTLGLQGVVTPPVRPKEATSGGGGVAS